MKTNRKTGFQLAAVIAAGLIAGPQFFTSAEAARPTQKQAMAACKGKYGNKVVNAIIQKNGSITCQYRVARPMTRAEVFESCRKKYGATTLIVQKKGDRWLCRYYGRY